MYYYYSMLLLLHPIRFFKEVNAPSTGMIFINLVVTLVSLTGYLYYFDINPFFFSFVYNALTYFLLIFGIYYFSLRFLILSFTEHKDFGAVFGMLTYVGLLSVPYSILIILSPFSLLSELLYVLFLFHIALSLNGILIRFISFTKLQKLFVTSIITPIIVFVPFFILVIVYGILFGIALGRAFG